MGLIGRRIGNVRILELIGEGGMGRVYRGFDERLERTVAVKTLRSSHRFKPDARSRFLREARILSKLDHDNICRIHDLLDHDSTDHLILEHVEGETLRSACRLRAETDILNMFLQIGEALAVAHGEGIVHRDLKPENVLVADDDRVKVLDFGIARSMEAPVVRRQRPEGPEGPASRPVDDATVPGQTEGLATFEGRSDAGDRSELTFVTRQGDLIGTVAYMSPEQAGGARITTASDLYSFGVMLQEMLTGEKPYGNDSGTDLLLRVFRADIRKPENLDPELARLIADLTMLDPDSRPTADETVDRIRWYLGRSKRRRARITRLSITAAVAVLLVAALGATITSRIQAGRRERAAQHFTAEAKDLEWRMLAEYLSRPHDIRPARREVLDEVARIERSIAEHGRFARGPGHFAIGRSLMALRDYESARSHLDQAWQAGSNDADVALSLAITYSALYQQAVVDALEHDDVDAREAALSRARKELATAARTYLQAIQPVDAFARAYVEALSALIDERYADAAELGRNTLEGAAWFYAGDVLAARALLTMAERAQSVDGDYERAVSIRHDAIALLDTARDRARSDPEILTLTCQAWHEISKSCVIAIPGRLSQAPALLAGWHEAIQRLAVVDPDSDTALSHQVLRFQVRALHALQTGEDPEPWFQKAFDVAGANVDAFPDDSWPTWVRGQLGTTYTWYLNYVGRDARDILDQAISDYSHAFHRDDRGADAALTLATTYFFRAVQENRYGGNPTPWTRDGAAAAERCLNIDPQHLTCIGMLGNLAFMEGLYAMHHGGDGRAAFEIAARAHERQAAMETNTEALSNLALDHCQLGLVDLSRGNPTGAEFETAIEVIGRVGKDQGTAHTFAVQGLAHRGLAEAGGRMADVTASVEAYERALELEPTRVETVVGLVEARRVGAMLAASTGADPTEHLRAASAAIARTLANEPDQPDLFLLSGELARLEARWLLSRNASPKHTLEQALRDLERSLDGCSDPSRAFTAISDIHLMQATWFKSRGLDPAPEIRLASQAAKRALEINPQSAPAQQVLQRIERAVDNREDR